jgi:tagaturonate reductase
MIIIPTELLPGNADKLKNILLQLAVYNKLEENFTSWLQTANHFCNSLVDRIVPGKIAITENEYGYSDELAIMSEVYRLWAIETANEKVVQALSFAQADGGVVLAPDIYKFRELKLRLLNGPHTLCCGLAILAGFTTVKQAMADEGFKNYLTRLMLEEVAPAITDEQISFEEAKAFALKVMDRFSNPYIEHKWLSISLQYSSKMLMRNIPILQKYYAKHNTAPHLMALGFAAYILFMKSEQKDNNVFTGTTNNFVYAINDDKAAILYSHWQQKNIKTVVQNMLADETLWSTDLNQFPGFSDAVLAYLETMMNTGAKKLIETLR